MSHGKREISDILQPGQNFSSCLVHERGSLFQHDAHRAQPAVIKVDCEFAEALIGDFLGNKLEGNQFVIEEIV
jgi:hypothetical protein